MPYKKIIVSIVFIVTLLTAAHAAKEVRVMSSEGHTLETQALIDSIRHMAHDSPDWVPTCKSLYKQAEADGDQLAKEIARYDEYVFYRNTHKTEFLDSTVKYAKLAMQECVFPDNEGLFYKIWFEIVNCCTHRGRIIRAEEEANALMQYATEKDSKVGLAYSYFAIAYISRIREDVDRFIDYTKTALDIIERFNLDIPSVHNQYGQLAATLQAEGRREEAYEIIKREYARAKKDTLQAHRSYPALCMVVDVILMSTSDSISYYKPRIERMLEEIKQREFSKGSYSNFAETYYHLESGEYKEAIECARICYKSGIIQEEGYYYLSKLAFQRMGDFESALSYADSLYEFRDSLHRASNNSTFVEMQNALAEDKLSMENKDLQAHVQKQRLILMTVGMASLVLVVLILFTFLYQLRMTNKKLSKANAVKDDFIRNMSHEFRTPLNIINGFADILTDKTSSDPELSSYSKTIQGNTVTLAKMVEDIIKLSAYDSLDANEARNDVIPVTEFLGTRIAFLRPRVGADVDVAIKSADNGITAQISAKAFCDIFDNVLLNAINCTTVGLILVSVERVGGMVSVEVSDTGPGIPEDKWEWVFGRFNKLDTFRRGAGLGLSIARAAAESAGATVRVKSSSTEQPTGTVFEILLPPPKSDSAK